MRRKGRYKKESKEDIFEKEMFFVSARVLLKI
jgi:hypothetical protein